MRQFILCTVLILSSFSISGQVDRKSTYAENMDDPHIPIARKDYKTGKAYRWSKPEITTVQVNVNKNGENMIGDAANEPSLAISRTNPDYMVIGWRQFSTIESNFREAGYAYSMDGGQSWIFPEPIEAGTFRSDPVLDVDKDGNFYYNSLSSPNNFQCDVFKSGEDFQWDEGTPAQGGDKQWMVIDKTDHSTSGNIYSAWSWQVTSCSPHEFTRSLDNGMNFESCVGLPNFFRRGTMAVGPEGELYVCGNEEDDHYIAKSENPGDPTFTWDFHKKVNMGGGLVIRKGPNPGGMLGQVWIDVDHSDGPNRGNVYMLSTVKNGFWSKADIMFSRSTDGGNTWSQALRINDNELITNWQWFGTLSVAPNGRIDVAWLDTREDPDGFDSQLYYSYSLDGGENWSDNIVLSDPFDPLVGHPNQDKIGDYYHMISDNESAHLAWAATFNGEQDVYYSRIRINTMTGTDSPGKDNFISISPNPTNGLLNIELDPVIGDGRIRIYDTIGKSLRSIEVNNNSVYTLDLSNEIPGLYFVVVSSKFGEMVRKVYLE
ncbi:MAG: T9SS type A sorting domain-containing protein [Bacteroidota bacterium]